MNIREVINKFPEPFKSTVEKVENFVFDYTLNEAKNDHDYLKECGYGITIRDDYSYNMTQLKNLFPSGYYGEWGTVYNDAYPEEMIDGYCQSFYEFCKMYDEGIVKLWRIRAYIDRTPYTYDDRKKTWEKFENDEWKECGNPMEKEKVSDDLEEAADYYASMASQAYKVAFKAGAEWQKEQIMKDAVDAEASYTMSVPSILISLPIGIKVGDKVKVIIIKQENKNE